ncbi:acyclic terpene utilization AtuA family protein [Azospirillum sp. B4]|uniref:acyclic terpene utilization AtuA family protein n=1 Tax=Azospirillum sp. B4 TaxID=95605 RepID=UPI00034919CC|nr:acyclic terpene utilization AtuA family protein [Azospirillum sp. B4]
MLDGPIKILVPTGSLGAGAREDEVRHGIVAGAHAIATDAGSTDSGAAYLALGISKNNRGSVKRDLTILMKAAAAAKIPLIVGTSGQAGGDLNLDWTRDIAVEVAAELGIQPKIALLYCEQDKALLKARNAAGKIRPLPPLGPLEDASIDACDHIVAVMGPEPYIAALRAGADIILGGRTTDTAVLASFALMKGAHAGAAWHAAKVAECGAQCTVQPSGSAGVLISIGDDGFQVEPLNPKNRCDPHSVSAHMLYENANPFVLTEPGGVLDVTDARYLPVDDRVVRVSGSVWTPKPYTMKLEGAGGGRYQTIMLIGIQDPDVLSRVDEFHDRMLAALYERTRKTMGLRDTSSTSRCAYMAGTPCRATARRPAPHRPGKSAFCSWPRPTARRGRRRSPRPATPTSSTSPSSWTRNCPATASPFPRPTLIAAPSTSSS